MSQVQPSSKMPNFKSNAQLWLRSRFGLTMTSEQNLIEDFAVLLKGTEIKWVGKWKDRPEISINHQSDVANFGDRPQSQDWAPLHPDSHGIVDLGDALVFPGLINAHAHLEYSHLHGEKESTSNFVEWIQWIVGAKSAWSDLDFERSWITGAKQSLKHGCLWIADHQSCWQKKWTQADCVSAHNEPLPKIIAFPEYIHFTPNPEVIKQYIQNFQDWRNDWIEARHKTDPRQLCVQQIGAAPHAPYTTLTRHLQNLSDIFSNEAFPCTIHVAESAEEMEMFLNQSGALYEMMQRLGRPAEQRKQSPLSWINESGWMNSRTILTHMNHLNSDDWQILQKSKPSIAHTPRCHEYFQRDPFHLKPFIERGIPVSLGTDSLASVCASDSAPAELDLKAEARLFQQNHPEQSFLDTLARITTTPARSLGIHDCAGQIQPGFSSDLSWINLDSDTTIPTAETAAAIILNTKSPVSGICMTGVPMLRNPSLNECENG